MFKLNERLEKDTLHCCDFDLCEVRIMPDSQCPWVILVPKKAGMVEVHELSEEDQTTLMQEITQVSNKLKVKFSADKINVGALGNMVPQLHIHVIARYKNDRGWPGPIWGIADQNPAAKDTFVAQIKALLSS